MKRTRYLRLCTIVFLCAFLTNGCEQKRDIFDQTGEITRVPEEVVEVTSTPIPVTEAEPSSETMSRQEILIKANAVIGEFSTYFAKSSDARKKNIKNAVKKINQTVVYPQEIFSICEYITPFTEENGYLKAGSFVNGQIVNSYGGGACQVSTTLYNAVLDAELLIVERHPHSMAVSYVEIGRDAAIAENLKDFRFQNILEVPIVIEAVVTNYDSLIFRIRSIKQVKLQDRKVVLETKILERIEPSAPIIEYDESKPKDYILVKQAAHTGYKAEVYRIVYMDGTEVERERISYNEYEPSPQYMVVGKK